LKITATVPLGQNILSQLPPDLQVLAQNFSLSTSAHPGEVIGICKGLGPIIQTGEGLLLLQEVQLSGKRPQSGWDFANGMRLTVGEMLANG
jgi:methionyl-tRNA formyltransferase